MEKLIKTLVLVLVGVALGADAQGNLLRNGGFEDGRSYWNVNEWSSSAGKAEFNVVDDCPAKGKSCALVRHVSGPDNIALGQNLPCKGARRLRLDFSARVAITNGLEHPVSATFVTVNSEGRILQEALQEVTTADTWRRFHWSFQTHPDTTQLSIYLRCDKVSTYFDDVVLAESDGVCINGVIYWPAPEPEFVLQINNNSEATDGAPFNVKVLDAQKRQVSKNIAVTLVPGEQFISVPADFITGNYSIIVSDQSGEEQAVRQASIPAMPSFPSGRLNNFVSIIHPDTAEGISLEKPLVFNNPREGWVYFLLQTETGGEVSFPGGTGDALTLPAGVKTETMRFYPAGECKVTSPEPVSLSHCEIRAVPELMMVEYEGMPSRAMCAAHGLGCSEKFPAQYQYGHGGIRQCL